MKYQLFELLTYFVIYSFAGWLIESIYKSIAERKLINTGFLKGPFCPIYGIGAIIMHVFLSRFKDNVLLLFLAGFIILSIWEYIVGLLLEKIFNTKYWDYSNHKFNIHGRVCLTNSIYWGILGVIFIKYIDPFVESKLQLINTMYLKIIVYGTMVGITIDAITTIIKMKKLKSTLEKIDKLNLEIKEKIEEFKEVKETEKNKAKKELEENLQNVINKLDARKMRIMKKLYKHVYRMKKAFPAIESKEITEILNKKLEIIKNDIKNKKIKK